MESKRAINRERERESERVKRAKRVKRVKESESAGLSLSSWSL